MERPSDPEQASGGSGGTGRRTADGGRRPGQEEAEAGRRWSTARPDGCEVERREGGGGSLVGRGGAACGGGPLAWRWGRGRRSRRKEREGRPDGEERKGFRPALGPLEGKGDFSRDSESPQDRRVWITG